MIIWLIWFDWIFEPWSIYNYWVTKQNVKQGYLGTEYDILLQWLSRMHDSCLGGLVVGEHTEMWIDTWINAWQFGGEKDFVWEKRY